MKKVLSKPSIALVFITFVAVIIYSNIHQCPFVFDDGLRIRENVEIRTISNHLSLENLLKPRAIVKLTFALNYKFGKLNVFGYHLVNVLIHIINGFLVYFLAQTIFKQLLIPSTQRFGHSNSSNSPRSKVQSPRSEAQGYQPAVSQSTINNRQLSIYLMSLVTALIFIAHPIQTQAVTYTVQRCTSMATMFYLAAVLFYLKARVLQHIVQGRAQRAEGIEKRTEGSDQRPGVKSEGSEGSRAFGFQLSALYAISLFCGALAFFSKQNTASLPGVILLVEYLVIDRTWEGWKKKIPWFCLTFALWGFFVLYVVGFFSGGIDGRGVLEDVSDLIQETEYVSRWSYLCTQFNVLVIYIRLLFLPIGQNLDYLYRFNNTFFDGYTPLAFVFLIGIVAIGIWNVRKRPVIFLGIFWFFITLSVESSFIPISDALVEHRLYLPMFGLAIIVSYLVFYLLSKRILWSIVVSVIIVLCLGSATYLRNRVWQNSITLWSDVVAKSPLNVRAHNSLGLFLDLQGRNGEALHHYFEALKLRPNYAPAHSNLGGALSHQGHLQEAITHYLEALRINPDLVGARNGLGIALARQGKLGDAISHFSEALRINPENPAVRQNLVGARNGLGIALARQGKLGDAISHFSEALRINPENPAVRQNLERALQLLGNSTKAANTIETP